MSFGLGEQLEPFYKGEVWNEDKPWQIQGTTWRKYGKQMKARRERRRAKRNPECDPEYKRFKGYEY